MMLSETLDLLTAISCVNLTMAYEQKRNITKKHIHYFFSIWETDQCLLSTIPVLKFSSLYQAMWCRILSQTPIKDKFALHYVYCVMYFIIPFVIDVLSYIHLPVKIFHTVRRTCPDSRLCASKLTCTIYRSLGKKVETKHQKTEKP